MRLIAKRPAARAAASVREAGRRVTATSIGSLDNTVTELAVIPAGACSLIAVTTHARLGSERITSTKPSGVGVRVVMSRKGQHVWFDEAGARLVAEQPLRAVMREQQLAPVQLWVRDDESRERQLRCALDQVRDDSRPRHGERLVVLAAIARRLGQLADVPRARNRRLSAAAARVGVGDPEVV